MAAAELPPEFVARHYGGAVIENHVNVIRPRLDGG